MRTLILLLIPLTFLCSIAQARPDTTKMTCEDAIDLVQAEGAVVMTYEHHPRAGRLFRRFVANSRFCTFDEEARNSWVQTLDSPRCHVGKVCKPRN